MSRDRDDSERLLAAVAHAAEHERSFAIVGRGSKTFLSPNVSVGGSMLAVGDHCGVIDYRHDELVMTARAGTALVELRRVLAAQGQMMAFDPPMFAGDGTLGGAVATGLSGPGRPWYGALRDAVLGVTLINGRAERLRFGGSVMKNVAGYDVSRLMVGSFGTLGVLLDVSLKIMPRPQYESTRVFELDRDDAHRRVVEFARTPIPLSATCHADRALYVRLSGTEKGVRAAALAIGGDEWPHPAELWDSLRDRTHRFFAGARPYRVALPAAAAYPHVEGEWLTEWGGAQRWVKTSMPLRDVAALVRKSGGHAATFGIGAQQLDEGALKYYRRIKHAFDPKAIFNRGRLFPEIGHENGHDADGR